MDLIVSEMLNSKCKGAIFQIRSLRLRAVVLGAGPRRGDRTISEESSPPHHARNQWRTVLGTTDICGKRQLHYHTGSWRRHSPAATGISWPK